MPISSSNEWKEEVVKQFRYPGRVSMVMDIMSDVSKSDITITSQNVLYLTNAYTTIDNQNPPMWEVATMEGIWKADGSMYLPSREANENLTLPLWSATLISESTPLVLTYSFGKTTSFMGLSFVWDTTYNTWPSKFTIRGYDSGGNEKYTQTVISPELAPNVVDIPMDDVDSIKLEITQWSNPQLRARFSEISFGIMLELNEKQVLSIEETTKQTFVCASLPTDTQKYSIKNQIYREYLAKAQSVTVNKSSSLTPVSSIFNSKANYKGVATVEAIYWKADGSQYLPSRVVAENPDIPWMSDSDAFNSDNPIEIVITYEHPTQINRISIDWDIFTNSWPTNASLVGKDSNGETVLNLDISSKNSSISLQGFVATVKTIHITIREWSVPGWRARIGYYEAIMCYGNNGIPSEVNNLFDPTLQFGYSKYLTKRQRIRVKYGLDTYSGETLWLPEQIRYLDSWTIPTDAAQVDFLATTQLAFLTPEYQKGKYNPSGATFYALALEVLQNSNVIKESASDIPWYITPTLKNLSTVAPLPKMSENALLQLIAGASGCILGTEPTTGQITILPEALDSGYIISEREQLQIPSVSLEAPLRSVSVKMYNYTVDTASSEMFNGTIKLKGTQRISVQYSEGSCATNCTAQISGATVKSQVFYGYSAVFELVAPNAETLVTIVITGYKVSSSSVQVTTFLDNSIESGRDIVIDNCLVTNMDTLNTVATKAYEYYRRRNTVSTEYLGFPDLKAGDTGSIYSQYLNEHGYITEHSFKYNGAFSGQVTMLMEV